MCSQSCVSNFYWGRERILQLVDFSKLWGRRTVHATRLSQRVRLVSKLENWHEKGRDAVRGGAGLLSFRSPQATSGPSCLVKKEKERNTGAAPVLFHLSFLTATLPHPGSARPDIEDNFSGVRETSASSRIASWNSSHMVIKMAICERRANAYLPLISGLLSTISKIGDRSLPVTSS